MAPFQQQEEEKTKEEAEEVIEEVPFSAGDPVVAAAVGSVLYSWYKFYLDEDAERGLFVGLWAPTLLAAASYLQQKDIVRRFKQGLSF